MRVLYGMPGLWGLLALVLLYKLGDAFAGSLTMTFFLRGQGFTLTEIGATYKALGMVASIVGGVAGGLWMRNLGLFRALCWFGVLQAVTNLGFLFLALSGKSLAGMIVVVALENLSGGMGTSALVAMLIGMCVRQFTATHFALLSALASMPRVLIGPAAGHIAELSWSVFFLWSVVLALPGLALLPWLRRHIAGIEFGWQRERAVPE
jgi:PAT family beta-lactamase induction signal transducer AmpG